MTTLSWLSGSLPPTDHLPLGAEEGVALEVLTVLALPLGQTTQPLEPRSLQWQNGVVVPTSLSYREDK